MRFFSLSHPLRGVIPVPEGVRSKKRKSHNFGQNAPAQNDLICSKNGQNFTHTCTCTRALNVTYHTPKGVIPPPKGVVREPGSRRLNVRYEKKIT